jgi:hypothetical protein
MSGRVTLAAVFVGLTLAGCGGSGAAPSGPRRSAIARAQAAHEYPASGEPRQRAARAEGSGAAAVGAFASAYINWTAETVSADMRALASRSVGQARAAVQLAAAETASDYELQRGGIANSGVVEAIAPLRGHSGQYAVVTRELTTATATTAYQGLRPAWHIAIATVAETAPGEWVVSGWQPQS